MSYLYCLFHSGWNYIGVEVQCHQQLIWTSSIIVRPQWPCYYTSIYWESPLLRFHGQINPGLLHEHLTPSFFESQCLSLTVFFSFYKVAGIGSLHEVFPKSPPGIRSKGEGVHLLLKVLWMHTSPDFIIKIGLSVNGRYGMLYMGSAFKL